MMHETGPHRPCGHQQARTVLTKSTRPLRPAPKGREGGFIFFVLAAIVIFIVGVVLYVFTAIVPKVPPIDAVLLSHDHHADNLDDGGRAYLTRAPLTLTTRAGAQRLGPPAQPLTPWESYELHRPGGEPVLVTAVAASPRSPGPPAAAAPDRAGGTR